MRLGSLLVLWVLATEGVAGLDCAVAQSTTPPDGVSVRLELKDGKTNYLLGEPIEADLTIAGTNSVYRIEPNTNSDEYETLTLTSREPVWRWNEMDHPGAGSSDAIFVIPIKAQGHIVPIRLNDTFDFARPGTYTLTVTTSRLRTPDGRRAGVALTTNPVTFTIAPMSQDEETMRVKALVREIDEDKEDAARQIAAYAPLM